MTGAQGASLPVWYGVLSGLLALVLGIVGPILAKRIGARGEVSQDRRVDFNSILAAQDSVIEKMQVRMDAERVLRTGIETELREERDERANCEGVLMRAGWRRIEGEWRLVP